MKTSKYQCKDCQYAWNHLVESGTFPGKGDLPCSQCGSRNTVRVYRIGGVFVGEGKVGNAANNYTNSLAYVPSMVSPSSAVDSKMNHYDV